MPLPAQMLLAGAGSTSSSAPICHRLAVASFGTPPPGHGIVLEALLGMGRLVLSPQTAQP